MENIDTNQDRHIYGSPIKIVGLTGLGIVMTGVSLWVALTGEQFKGLGAAASYIGWFSTVFFGACTVAIVSQIFKLKKPVITLSPAGIFDSRVATETIPWSMVRDLSTYEVMGNEMLVVAVDPEFEAGMSLSRIAKMSRKANAKLGADGLVVNIQGTKIKYKTLMSWALAYAAAHGSNQQA